MSLPLPLDPPHATAAPDHPTLVRSDLLGDLFVEREELVHFAQGLYGFPECRGFVLVATEREGVFWLQSTEYGALAFLLIDPFLFFPDYRVDLPPAELRRLGVQRPEDVVVLSIATVPGDAGAPFTANLQGPVAINASSRKALQCVLPGEEFGVRAPFRIE